MSFGKIIVSALRGSSAKTVVSIGMTVALRRKGLKIIPFKKGPDYIDAAWLSKAAQIPCRHLDLYLMGEDGVRDSFYRNIQDNSLALIEGNRGLFDGVDIHGTYSTAKIATLLDVGVVLVIDATKTTNTIAPLIIGCQTFDPQVNLQGIILNRVAGKRHEETLTKSIEYHTGLPVLGVLPKLELTLPERHLGLLTANESSDGDEKCEILGSLAEKYLHLEELVDKVYESSSNECDCSNKMNYNGDQQNTCQKDVTVGIIRDKAFQFYYPENLEALENEGAQIIEFNSLEDTDLKPIDLLYIGGGFPEVYAEQISKNRSFCDSIKKHAGKGLPIYGECGAVIYLGKSLNYHGQNFPMCNVFSLDFEFFRKPVGHGYSVLEVTQKNPYFPLGTTLKGHEFHYSLVKNKGLENQTMVFEVKKGFGFDGKVDGILKDNVLLSYTHLHAAGAKYWASGMIHLARERKFSKSF